jgi:hypothetical protein
MEAGKPWLYPKLPAPNPQRNQKPSLSRNAAAAPTINETTISAKPNSLKPSKDRQLRPLIFPAGCLRDYRNRTEALRAVANRDLIRILAGREDRDAARFTRPRS